MKIAFVHDWLTGMRGGEKVLEAALEVYPSADIHTLLHNPKRVGEGINRRVARTSWIQSLPFVHRYYRYLLPLMPHAIGRFDLGGYDLVISFSHCVAKGVRTGADGRSGRGPLHICYCFTPMRYIYDQFESYFPDDSSRLARKCAERLRPYLARWDRKTADGVHRFIACSENVRKRIQRAYGRDAEVVYPPVDTEFFDAIRRRPLSPSKPYYLVAGALVPYKRVDLAVEACRLLNVPLKIVGVGSEEEKLRRSARGAPAEFLGWRSQDELKRLYQGCEALLHPQEEDFGIAAVEAMACGRPVIAYKKGGALETVAEGKTGLFFGEQSAEALAGAMREARRMRFDPRELRARALGFSRETFKSRLSDCVQKALSSRPKAGAPRAPMESPDQPAAPA